MEWKEIERDFNEKWNFPGCYGATDGKRTAIRAPANCGSTFYNYKKGNSIVLMAVVGTNYQFTTMMLVLMVPYQMMESPENCSLFEALENGLLPNNGVIIGDNAFLLKTSHMKPYLGANLTSDEKI